VVAVVQIVLMPEVLEARTVATEQTQTITMVEQGKEPRQKNLVKHLERCIQAAAAVVQISPLAQEQAALVEVLMVVLLMLRDPVPLRIRAAVAAVQDAI